MTVENALKEMPVIGILRGFSKDQVFRILELYQECGFHMAEVTLNTENALSIISTAVKTFDGLFIGAGTVCDIKDYQAAKDAGSQFIVTPILDEQVVTTSVKDGIPIFPGAFSPSEVYKAWKLGATMVKVFPGGSLGYQYIKELQGPLPQIPLAPTGGVSIDNLDQFMKAGAKGVGMGGKLFLPDLINEGNWSGLKDHFLAFNQKMKQHLSASN